MTTSLNLFYHPFYLPAVFLNPFPGKFKYFYFPP